MRHGLRRALTHAVVALTLGAGAGILAPLVSAVGGPVARAGEPTLPLAAEIINLGHVEVRAVPDFQPPPPAPISAVPAEVPFVIYSRPVSLEEAEATVDFAVMQPTWLPSPDYQLAQVMLLGDQEVILIYRDTTVVPGQEPPRDIAIHERRWATIGARGVPASIEEGTIDGQLAAFWTQAFPAPALPAGEVTRLFAAVERGDLYIEFNTAGLTQETLIQVAESLSE